MLSYFQKQSFSETDSNILNNELDNKIQEKLNTDDNTSQSSLDTNLQNSDSSNIRNFSDFNLRNPDVSNNKGESDNSDKSIMKISNDSSSSKNFDSSKSQLSENSKILKCANSKDLQGFKNPEVSITTSAIDSKNCDNSNSNKFDNNASALCTTKTVHNKGVSPRKCMPPPRPPPPVKIATRICVKEGENEIHNVSVSTFSSLDLENADEHITDISENDERTSLPKSISNLSLYNTPFTLAAQDVPLDTQVIGNSLS